MVGMLIGLIIEQIIRPIASTAAGSIRVVGQIIIIIIVVVVVVVVQVNGRVRIIDRLLLCQYHHRPYYQRPY